ncbi:regulating synaptic membrane exocytosis protein 1 [Lingula anatina]|uniref:Regulating synaptic membrane exocytosis protein 1 n=1 Tax=Lingula anatina TaxID=7574 RepID=A0A1S3IGT8_LINAN|nr:regulating synaptic membrane exocytosis protein 1 [Lingula anatina]|eukprot:XP_013397432.1 regulating synaptic membrane exocytosis protein 1 [Lingula anatina]
MADGPDVFVCKIHVKQEVSEDQEKDIKELTSTEFDIHWMLPFAPPMDLYNFDSYSGGPASLRSAPQWSSHPLPGAGEEQRHGGNNFQSRPNQQYYQKDPYQQNQPRFQFNTGNQQYDLQSQTARKVVVRGQNEQNEQTPQSEFSNQFCVIDIPDKLQRSQGSLSGPCRIAEEDHFSNIPVFGKILLSMKYDYRKGWLIIHIYRCQDLAPADVKKNRSDPYVKTYLLPDKSRGGKRKTKIKKNTLNPTFDESLHYTITKNELKRRILWLSVWHSVTFDHNVLLGDVVLPLNKQNFNDTSPQWFQLSGDHMAAGDRDQGITYVTDPHSIKTTRGQVLNQADVGNQWQRSTLLEISLQPNFDNQQDDFQSQTTRKMVVQGQYQQNQPSSQPNYSKQSLQQDNFQSQTLPGESTGPNQRQEGQESRLPQEPVTDHHLNEQGVDHVQTRRQSGHDFPPLSPQQDLVAAGDQDQAVTDPQTIKTMGNQALNQVHGDNQLERLPTAVTHEIAGFLSQLPPSTGNTNVTLNFQLVNHNYNSEKESLTHMKEKDVTTSFHKYVPPHVKKRLNETLSQDDIWNQMKKMYGISDETPRPPDVVSYLLSQVEGSIASFISVLLKLKERHREGQQDIPQNLIDEVKVIDHLA